MRQEGGLVTNLQSSLAGFRFIMYKNPQCGLSETMMVEADDALQAPLAELKREYAAALPDKLQELQDNWRAAQETGEREPLVAMYRTAHQLTGSGATYGFAEITATARALELYLKPRLRSSQALTTEESSQVAQLLAMLADAVNDPQEARARPAGDVTPRLDEMPPSSTPSKRIFIAEDNGGRELLADHVRHFGYAVATFDSLEALQSALEREPPDALIIDTNFPQGSAAGIALIHKLQAGRLAPLPVIFTSAHDDLASRLDAARAGGVAYFTKPLKFQGLMERLDLLLARRAPEPYRILIVEGDPSQARELAELLQGYGMITTVIGDLMTIMSVLTEMQPDLIVLDMTLRGCTGIELATVIRQQDDYMQTPIVFISNELAPDEQLKAISLGVDDFLTKPIHPEHLVSSVTSRAYRSHLLRSYIARDSLTGVLNHTAFKEQLDIEIARAQRQSAPLTLAMIDLDHFKSVNDTYGHPTGDAVLKSLTRLLQQRLRKTDVVGRYGGEEFTVLLPNTSAPAGMRVMDEIRVSFGAIRHLSDASGFCATLSAGLAQFPTYPDASQLLRAADKALYDAKRAGRNRIVLAVVPPLETNASVPRNEPRGADANPSDSANDLVG